MKRRILAMLLALVMCLSTLPTAAFAVEGTAEESSAVTAEEATDAQEESADEAEEPAAAEEEATDAQEESTDEAEEPVAAEEDPAPAEEPEDDDSDDGSDIEVTRAEWLSALVKAFDMSVESGDSPDNYFSDLSSDSEYYDDIILAVEFGVVDVEAGGSIYPDAAATRDFAATTLNYCLGFQMDEDVSYDFTDSEDCSSPDDAQIAVDRGWFALIDGKFSPDTAITSAEMTVMLADAADVLAAAEIHENYDSSYQFADYVIQIYDDVEFNDDGTITIDSDSTGLSVGDTFVVYSETGPVLYTAESIITLASKTTVTTGEADVESALLSIDVEESVEADLSTFEAEADVETVYLATEAQAEEYSKNSGSSISYKAGTLVAQTTVTLDNGCKASVTVTIANMKLHKNIKSTKNFTVSFSGDITVDSTVSVDALAALGASSSITIGKIAWGPGSITISVDLSLNGKITATYTGNFEAGFGYSNGTFRLVKSFSKKSFSTTVEATASIGVKATAGVDLLVASGSIYATMGVSAKFTSNTYDDGETPENCVSISAWLYAKVGASAKILFKSYSKTKEIYTSSNSPYRISYHYEDGVKVSSCTRGSGSGYTTSDDSGLGSSSYGGGSSTGTGSGGSTYTIYTYSLDDDNNATITGYNGNVTALSIPETIDGYTVTAIGSSAFSGNTKLRVVVIPDTVTSIGNSAFKNCTSLTKVTLSSNLTTLSYYAFYGCTALTTITIPASLTSCPTYYGSCGPFNNSGLQVAVIEDGAETIPAYLFYGASNLVSVTIPDSVTSIGVSAFQGCTSLTGVVLPDTLTSLGSYAFYGCKSLTEITIPSSLTSASQPFSSSGLQSAILEDGTKTILANLFYGASSLTAVTIPETVTSIGENAFRDCTSLVTFTISENITTIGGSAFRGCTALTGIVLPDSVSSIGTYVFSGCTSLTDVAWNNTVASIPSDTFNGCTGLVNFTLPSTVTAINSYAFNGCTALANITWSENLTTISEGAFYNCDALASLGLPDSVTTIGSKAFYDCDGLVTAIIPDSVTSIGGSAFYNCDALTTVDIGDSVASIGGSAFYNCDALTTVNISDSVTSLGTYVFYDCDALTDVTLGTGLTSIPADTFESCGALESIVIPYRVASIGNYAFKNCYSLTSVTIPRAVTSIGTEVFSYPSQMTIYGVTDTYAETYADENGITFVAIDISATKVTLSETALLLNKGATATLAMTVTPENFTDEVTWKSTDTSVATITDAGLVTAVAVGTATIKVTVGDVSATCKVTVVQPVTSISLNKTSLTLEALDTYQLTATVKPTDAYDTSVAWTSSDESVATVDENGLVTALGKGTATITVAAQDGSGVTKTCSVTVSNTAHIVSTVDELESDHNYANSCSDYWVYTLSGAETINVTFDERTEVEEDFDYLYIYDGNGSQIGQYTGTELAGQTVEITGDTVRIKLVSDSSGTAWGFKVVSVVDPNNVTTDISTCTVTLSYTAISYNGSAREPKVTVKDGTTTLTQGTDYTVAYSNNVNAGTATVTVTGMGSYTGTTEVSFTIRKITQTLTTEISSDTLAVGETAQITATAEGTVRYTSSDTGVATVSSAGLVTAVAAGTVTITVKAAATDNYYSATNTIEITVTDDSTAPTLDAPVISSVYSTVQTSAKVTWTQVDGADGYQIYRSTEKDGTYTCIKTISGGSTVKYTNSGLTVGQTYYYKVRAYVKDSSNNWVYSEFSDVRYMPAAVVFDNVYSNSTSRIRILWNEISGAEGYQIWRADSEDGEYKIVKTITSGDTTAYSNTGLESGKTYYYKMRAFTTADGSKVFGAYSDVFAVAVTPETPTLTVTSSSAGIAKLSWDEISGAAGYQLWRSDSEDGTYTLVKSITSGSTTSYSNSGLTSGNTYYYKVRAYTEVSGKKTFGAYSTVQSVDVK